MLYHGVCNYAGVEGRIDMRQTVNESAGAPLDTEQNVGHVGGTCIEMRTELMKFPCHLRMEAEKSGV